MIETRTLHTGRRITEYALVEPRRDGRENPLRTEVLRNRKLDSYYCRACKIADGGCRHITAVRRFILRERIKVVK